MNSSQYQQFCKEIQFINMQKTRYTENNRMLSMHGHFILQYVYNLWQTSVMDCAKTHILYCGASTTKSLLNPNALKNDSTATFYGHQKPSSQGVLFLLVFSGAENISCHPNDGSVSSREHYNTTSYILLASNLIHDSEEDGK